MYSQSERSTVPALPGFGVQSQSAAPRSFGVVKLPCNKPLTSSLCTLVPSASHAGSAVAASHAAVRHFSRGACIFCCIAPRALPRRALAAVDMSRARAAAANHKDLIVPRDAADIVLRGYAARQPMPSVT